MTARAAPGVQTDFGGRTGGGERCVPFRNVGTDGEGSEAGAGLGSIDERSAGACAPQWQKWMAPSSAGAPVSPRSFFESAGAPWSL